MRKINVCFLLLYAIIAFRSFEILSIQVGLDVKSKCITVDKSFYFAEVEDYLSVRTLKLFVKFKNQSLYSNSSVSLELRDKGIILDTLEFNMLPRSMNCRELKFQLLDNNGFTTCLNHDLLIVVSSREYNTYENFMNNIKFFIIYLGVFSFPVLYNYSFPIFMLVSKLFKFINNGLLVNQMTFCKSLKNPNIKQEKSYFKYFCRRSNIFSYPFQ